MKCKLCGMDRTLKNSHFLPKNVYKRFKNSTAEGTDLMMFQGGKNFKTGKQITQYQLCECCERRFNKGGEDYFAKFAMPNPGDETMPPLYRILKTTLIPLWNKMGAQRLSLGTGFLPAIESDRILYFAVSMFWRGGLEGWPGYQKVIYEDGLMNLMQKFLLGQSPLTDHAVRIVPSFWAEKYSAVLPGNLKEKTFFNIFMYDFYLEKISKIKRNYLTNGVTPLIYTADSFLSMESHIPMTHTINNSPRSKNLPAEGDLISWSI